MKHRFSRYLAIGGVLAAISVSVTAVASTPAVEASAVVRAAPLRLVEKVLPAYPYELRREGLAGGARVELSVAADGRVRETRVISATHPEFGRAARQAAMQWRFAPTAAGADDVVAKVNVPFDFVASAERVEVAAPAAPGSAPVRLPSDFAAIAP